MFEDLILALDNGCLHRMFTAAWDIPTIEYAIAFAKKYNDRNKQVKNARLNLHTSYLFDIKCHFHSVYATIKHKCSF